MLGTVGRGFWCRIDIRGLDRMGGSRADLVANCSNGSCRARLLHLLLLLRIELLLRVLHLL